MTNRILIFAGTLILSSSFLPVLHAQTTATEEAIELSPFEVSGERDRGYGTTQSIGGTRIAVAVSDIPQAVINLNEEFLADIAPVEIIEATKYVSGINIASAPLNGQMTLRGYNIPGTSSRDGLDDPFGAGGAQMLDLATSSRIEVIKGPAGVLYGIHNPGGVINTVTKRPQFEQRSNIKVTAGDFRLFRTEVDTTGPLGGSGKLAYRFIGVYQDAETYFGGQNDREVAAGLFTYRPTKQTTAMVRFEYQHANVATSANAWFVDSTNAFSELIPIRNVGDERDEAREHWNYSWEADVTHRLASGPSSWVLRANLRINHTDEDKMNYNKRNFRFVSSTGDTLGTYRTLTIANAVADPTFDDVIVDLDWRRDLYNITNRILNLDAVGSFSTGPTDHKLITYLQFSDVKTDGLRRVLGDFPSKSALRPVYSDNPSSLITNQREIANSYSEGDGWAWGLQDQIKTLEDRLIFSVGTRYTVANAISGANRLTGAQITGEKEDDWVYRFGVVGKPAQGVSLFYNYSQTFNPIQGTAENGEPWKNQVGEINEVGVKLELLDSALTMTASYFDLTLDNFIVTVVNTDTGLPERRQEANNSTTGWEMDLAWQANKNISFLAALGDMDSVNQNGIRARGVSQGLNVRLLGKYTFDRGPLNGLAVGLGYEYTNDRAGDAADTFSLPSFSLWDAFVTYRYKEWTFQVNAYNLTDEIYPQSSVAAQFVWVGDPRKIRASVGWSF